ncbi:TetR/AcrR family transcriptional regulator [Microbacterium sp. KR10-403]|uniref:TetR/AcrR family transcriptional regulator n=1 Tax=Microbacterium sp. KR10-403 TaxID=3158581 RepID=UPI0032E3D2BE
MTTTAAQKTRTEQTGLTRARIVSAARLLFTTRGYRAVSLRDIAAEAGVTHPGLLRHFSGKEELLDLVLKEFDDRTDTETWQALVSEADGALAFSLAADRNARIPGYLPLFAGLVGEASVAGHPAHAVMRGHAERFGPAAREVIDAAIIDGTVAADRDPDGEALRLMAAWDALQVVELYLPDRVDTAAMIAEHERLLAYPFGWRDPSDAVTGRAPIAATSQIAPDAEAAGGYRSGRERRARILAAAMTLFAREGYADTSLRDLAAKVGVSKSALYHHFPSKDALLLAVLEERDRLIDVAIGELTMDGAADFLRALPDAAEENDRTQPGLIELYAVISCEGIPTDHPAHDYFTARFTHALDSFEAMFRAAASTGELPSHRDPAHEAAWLLALWDGLQYQWQYDRDGVDVAAQLRAHLDDVLPA